MDEKTEEKSKEKKPEEPAGDTEEGSKPEIYKPIDDANLAAKRVEDATKALREENDRAEEIAAKRALGGTADAGQPAEKPKELTDTEYAESLERGEVNPLKEDGFIK